MKVCKIVFILALFLIPILCVDDDIVIHWIDKAGEMAGFAGWLSASHHRATRCGQLVATAIFEVVAKASKGKLQPYLCHEQWDDMKFCGGGNCRPTDDKVKKAISYAAYRMLVELIKNPNATANLNSFMSTKFGINPVSNSYDAETPEGIGNLIGKAVHDDRIHDGANELGDEPGTPLTDPLYSDYTDWQAVNPPMPVYNRAGNCSLLKLNHYQPYRTIFGVSQWVISSTGAWRPFAARVFPIKPPNKYGTNTHAGFIQDYATMLSHFSTLNDFKKAHAILHNSAQLVLKNFTTNWAFMNHFQFLIQIIQNTHLDYVDAAKLYFAFGSVMLDAAITGAMNKRFYDVVRPPTAMQCLYEGQTINSWAGPYQGVKPIQGETWMAYFNGLVNNPTPEYACEHCIQDGAWTGIMKYFYNSDVFRANCVVVGEGLSYIEPKITVGNPGYVAGLTDVPNTGPNSIGYAPATDVPLCWTSYDEYANQVINARIYLGVHTPSSGMEGVRVGRVVADRVWEKVSKYFGKKEVECKVIGDRPY